jgi:hypothetical protein
MIGSFAAADTRGHVFPDGAVGDEIRGTPFFTAVSVA